MRSGSGSFTLKAGAELRAIDGVQALRVGGGKWAELPIDISPNVLPECTIDVEFKLLSLSTDDRGWLVASDNGGYDRGVALHETDWVFHGVDGAQGSDFGGQSEATERADHG